MSEQRRSERCEVCREPSVENSYLCPAHRKLRDRTEGRHWADGSPWKVDKSRRVEAMKEAWDEKERVLRCTYTKVELSIDEPGRRYATWEHVIPGDEKSVVLVADVVNKMKGDLTFEQFERLVIGLAASFKGRRFLRRRRFPPTAFPPDQPEIGNGL